MTSIQKFNGRKRGRSCSSRVQSGGFSLIELAVVLVIIGLLIGGGITALIATNAQAQRGKQKHQMEQIRNALYGFAMANGRLPCPASANTNGVEHFDGNACDAVVDDGGFLPWVTLGLGRRDAWGNPLRYQVDTDFADKPTDDDKKVDTNNRMSGFSAFDFDDKGKIEVDDGEGEHLVQHTPAVVVAYGPQGGQVWADGFPCSKQKLKNRDFSLDEIENCDNRNNTFVVSDYRRATAEDGRFDDLVMWLPNSVLMARMVTADRLPRKSHEP